ncbi:c-type cytochrome, methanol metabolism-related [Aquabacter sp. CN5-332]|uniref:c-type cytochrome, methanol metabolism-related n=1 Tax=Aquabacter sp. CN5-332 TaxID=3156608 RepID=UPI0032B3E8D3
MRGFGTSAPFAGLAFVLALLAAGPGASQDKPPQDKPAKTQEDGKWFDADGAPTYNITVDGKVDWYTYSGFRRYHSECHVCHGPEGEGSTYAPALVQSLKTMKYPEFMEVVASGRTVDRPDKTSVMPALGDNPNVMCYIDDIFVYLKARADGAIPRGMRPERGVEKPETATKDEKACMGS